jgi:hypothetical protein
MLHFSICNGKPEATVSGTLSNGKAESGFSISFGKIGANSCRPPPGYPQYHCQVARLDQNEKKFNRNFIDGKKDDRPPQMAAGNGIRRFR